MQEIRTSGLAADHLRAAGAVHQLTTISRAATLALYLTGRACALTPA